MRLPAALPAIAAALFASTSNTPAQQSCRAYTVLISSPGGDPCGQCGPSAGQVSLDIDRFDPALGQLLSVDVAITLHYAKRLSVDNQTGNTIDAPWTTTSVISATLPAEPQALAGGTCFESGTYIIWPGQGVGDPCCYTLGTFSCTRSDNWLFGTAATDLLLGNSGAPGTITTTLTWGASTSIIWPAWPTSWINDSVIQLTVSYNYSTLGSPQRYFTPKLNSQGCLPLIQWSGLPTISGPDNFTIAATLVRNNQMGLMFWGPVQASVPFGGGTRCVGAPLIRVGLQQAGGTPPGTPDCSGTYAFHFSHAFMAHYFLQPGSTINAQWWQRDPPHLDGSGMGLTDAASFGVYP